jgi:hypothetical protein
VSEVKSREASPRRSRLKVNWPASWSDTSASEDNTSLNADTSRELPGPHTRQGALRRPAAAQPRCGTRPSAPSDTSATHDLPIHERFVHRSIPSKRSAVPQQPGGWNDTTSVEQPRIRRQASELDAPLPRGPPQKGRGRGGRQNRRPLATEVRAGAGRYSFLVHCKTRRSMSNCLGTFKLGGLCLLMHAREKPRASTSGRGRPCP